MLLLRLDSPSQVARKTIEAELPCTAKIFVIFFWYDELMPNITQLAKQYQDLPEDEQKKAGAAIAGKMDPKVEEFLKGLLKLLDEKQIDTSNPDSFIKRDVYDTMPQPFQAKTDMALVNIADQVRRIEEFYKSTQTPNESPQLQAMIEGLWQMKQRIEEHYDVFKF